MSETEISKAAKTLSRLGASKGGQVRAAKLTPERRAEIAQKAADAKWGIPKATHAGELQIGDMNFQCSVLSDGTRVITQSDFMEAMGMYYSGWVGNNKAKMGQNDPSAELPHFLAFDSLKPFIDKHLGDLQSIVVPYRTAKGTAAKGIKAEIIPKICEVWLDADENGKLIRVRQKQIVQKAKILMRALAHTGIIALVDEATGYQEVRDRLALQTILNKYITDEWAKWTKTFDDDYYKELFRLHGVEYPGETMKRPQYIGHWTNDIIYSRLAPGVLKTLKEINPRLSSGHRARKHHMHLTRDYGHPELKELLSNVVFLMKSCATWNEFKRRLDRVKPKYGDTIPMDLKDKESGELV